MGQFANLQNCHFGLALSHNWLHWKTKTSEEGAAWAGVMAEHGGAIARSITDGGQIALEKPSSKI